ncbi:hypothetical protein [Streptomyces cinereoruber]|uniref:hypothetical protein n=1 Tax=Streptomyces cinereoruber TaxID=67260 RepID=UPI003625C2B9
MTTDAYFEELAGALRAADVPEEQIGRTVAELRGHLAETGTAPEEEFGPAARFAARLGGLAPAPGEPDGSAEHWTWTADLFNDRQMLAVHGDQGWEVESLDAIGRFVCRRVPGAELAWEYRREVITDRRRAQVLDELEPEGWEPCGEWLTYGYFKRPKAATAGPAGTPASVPPPPAQWLFLSRRGKAALAVWTVLAAAAFVALGPPGYAMVLMGVGWAVTTAVMARREAVPGGAGTTAGTTGKS